MINKTKSIKDVLLIALIGIIFILVSVILFLKDNHETLKKVYGYQLYLTDSLLNVGKPGGSHVFTQPLKR
jgi:Co/Zn/Cd efflux system component